MFRKNKSRLIFLIILSVICVIGALIVFKAPNNAKENNSSNNETIIIEYPDFSVKSSFGSIIHNKTVTALERGNSYDFSVSDLEDYSVSVYVNKSKNTGFGFIVDNCLHSFFDLSDISSYFNIEKTSFGFTLSIQEDFSMIGLLRSFFIDNEVSIPDEYNYSLGINLPYFKIVVVPESGIPFNVLFSVNFLIERYITFFDLIPVSPNSYEPLEIEYKILRTSDASNIFESLNLDCFGFYDIKNDVYYRNSLDGIQSVVNNLYNDLELYGYRNYCVKLDYGNGFSETEFVSFGYKVYGTTFSSVQKSLKFSKFSDKSYPFILSSQYFDHDITLYYCDDKDITQVEFTYRTDYIESIGVYAWDTVYFTVCDGLEFDIRDLIDYFNISEYLDGVSSWLINDVEYPYQVTRFNGGNFTITAIYGD